MTENEILRIDLALESSGGKRAPAAVVLQMATRQLTHAVHNNPTLRKKWGTSGSSGSRTVFGPTDAPTGIESMALGPPALTVPPVTPAEQQLATISASDDAALRNGLADLGLNDSEAQEVVALASFHKQHSARSVDIFGATLVKRGLRLSVLIAKLEEDIRTRSNLRDIWSPDGTMLIRSGEESKFDLLYRGLAELRKMTDLAHTGAMARAKMKLWDKHGLKGATKERKPGFTPLQRPPAVAIQVQSGGNVTLNENGKNHGPSDPSKS